MLMMAMPMAMPDVEILAVRFAPSMLLMYSADGTNVSWFKRCDV